MKPAGSAPAVAGAEATGPADRLVDRFVPAQALALGALQTPAFVHTWAWPLPLLTLAWLVWRLGCLGRPGRSQPARAALLGLCYATGWLTAGVWWLFVSMHRYGGIAAPLAALAVLALAVVLGLYLAAACAAYARWRRGRPGPDALLFAALWLLAELARGTLFTGFPWLASGYAQVDGPLAALAPWLGVYGLGAVAAWWAAALAGAAAAAAAARPPMSHSTPTPTLTPTPTPTPAWRGAALAAALGTLALAAAAVLGPGEHTRPAGRLTVTLLQPFIAQDEKFAAERLPLTLAELARALAAAPPGLAVAPETALPLLPAQLDEVAPGYWRALRESFASPARAALVGLPLGDFERGYTNSVAGLSAAPAVYRYDKHHLVPFGEFIPPGFRWFTDAMRIPLGDFARGVVDPPSFEFAGQRIAPHICYEDLFGAELARRFADPARAPTLLANLSNIGWFGDTIAIPQHLNISRMRALELQRPLVRATNTGATAIVDHRGDVAAALAPHTRGRLVGEVEGRQGLTPYAAWAARWGHAPLALAALAVVLAFALSSGRAAASPAARGGKA